MVTHDLRCVAAKSLISSARKIRVMTIAITITLINKNNKNNHKW